MAIDFSANIVKTIEEAGQTCDIKKAIQSVDDIGQTIRDFIAHKTGVTCWMQEKSSTSVSEDGKIFLSNRVVFYFSADPEILEGYTILFDSKDYIVEGINNMGGLGQLWRADMEYKI